VLRAIALALRQLVLRVIALALRQLVLRVIALSHNHLVLDRRVQFGKVLLTAEQKSVIS
jgi:hypothetical protein